MNDTKHYLNLYKIAIYYFDEKEKHQILFWKNILCIINSLIKWLFFLDDIQSVKLLFFILFYKRVYNVYEIIDSEILKNIIDYNILLLKLMIK